MYKKHFIIALVCFPFLSLATVSESRKIIGVLKDFNKTSAIIFSNEKVITVGRKAINQKYPNLKPGMLIEIDLSVEDFSKVVSQDASK
jgi:hypothetical protein